MVREKLLNCRKEKAVLGCFFLIVVVKTNGYIWITAENSFELVQVAKKCLNYTRAMSMNFISI